VELDLWHGLLLGAVGIVAGFLNVMAGGGSLLTVPVMVFMGLPGPVANGTNRIAILAQNLTAVVTFFRRGFSDFRLSLTLAACALPGSLLGALVGTRLDGVWFNRILALVMLVVMLIMHFDRGAARRPENYQPTRRQLVAGHLLMIGAGFWGGFILAVYTVAALAVFASQVEVLWIVGLALAVGNSIGGYLGAHFTISSGERLVRLVLNLVLVLFIIKLLFSG
jgi:uncharacterized membrane protein YfcA